MLFGIQSSQDVKLSNISRSLQEKITLIRTEKRLSRNVKSAELEKELTPQLVRTLRGGAGQRATEGGVWRAERKGQLKINFTDSVQWCSSISVRSEEHTSE